MKTKNQDTRKLTKIQIQPENTHSSIYKTNTHTFFFSRPCESLTSHRTDIKWRLLLHLHDGVARRSTTASRRLHRPRLPPRSSTASSCLALLLHQRRRFITPIMLPDLLLQLRILKDTEVTRRLIFRRVMSWQSRWIRRDLAAIAYRLRFGFGR